jgi:hypothetical protein
MRRILVFQPDATAPSGASLPVGLVREDALVPRVQLLVKATFGFAPAEEGGPPPTEATLLAAQEAIAFKARRRQPSDAESAPDALIVPADAAVDVEGGHTVRLPGIEPRLFLEGGGRAARPVALRCDSLWIDDERARLVAVWRGRVEVKHLRAREIERITLRLERAAAPLSTAHRPRQGCYSFAVEADDESSGPRDQVEEARLSMALLREAATGTGEPQIPLETFAALSAELGEKRESPAEILRRHGIHPLDFRVEEQAWLGKIGEAASAGDGELSAAYGAAFLAAQDRLGRPEEARFSLADYIEIRARLEGGQHPGPVLREHAMTLPEWMRLDRRWKREADESPELGEELVRLVKEAQGQGPEESE